MDKRACTVVPWIIFEAVQLNFRGADPVPPDVRRVGNDEHHLFPSVLAGAF